MTQDLDAAQQSASNSINVEDKFCHAARFAGILEASIKIPPLLTLVLPLMPSGKNGHGLLNIHEKSFCLRSGFLQIDRMFYYE